MGQADDRWFCFAAGFGFDAAIVLGRRTQRRRGKRSTHALYARVGVREFFRADRRHPASARRTARRHAPGRHLLRRRHQRRPVDLRRATARCTRRPRSPSRPGSGIYARRRMGTPGMLWSMARMSGSRPRVGRRGAVVVHDEEHVTVIADEPLPFQVDGDALDLGTR